MKRIAIVLVSTLSLSAYTQEGKDSSTLDPVEVRAVRASATAPFAKTNIGKKEIARQNLGQDLPFLLNQTPSVVASSDAGNGVGYTGIRIRGTDATRINITLNGIPYNDAESQGSFFVNLPDFASSVSSIQVQRGVGTSTNGAGAFGATINLSTNEVNREPYAAINNSYGSFNTWKNTVMAGSGLINGHITTDIRLSRISSDGYIDRASSDLKSFYFSTAYLSGKTDLRLNIFSGKEKTYQAWNGVSEADLKTNRTVNYSGMEKPGEPYDNEVDNYQQDHYQLFLTRRFSSRLSFNTAFFLTRGRGYYEQYKAEQDYADYNLPYATKGRDTIFTTDLVRRLWLDNYFYGNTFSLQFNGDKTGLVLGGALTRYDGDHFGEVIWASQRLTARNEWYRTDAYKTDLNLYAKWQQNLSATLQVFADMQYRGLSYDLDGFRNNPNLFIRNSYHFFNPKLGLSYHRGSWLAYASYSIGNKEPNRDDFEAGQRQQPKPERLYDTEAGLEYKTARSSWGANLYYMLYRDQLVLSGKINDVGAYTRTNIPKSYRLGIELQGSAVVNSWLRASANLTLSRNRISDFTEYIDDYDNGGQQSKFYPESDISFSPAITGAATVTLAPVKALSVDLLSKYVSEQYLDNTGSEERKLDAYFVQDLRLIYSKGKGWLKNADFIVQVNNILNRKYEANGYTFSYIYNGAFTTENYYYPMAGINWMTGINLRF
ncbi:MAG TPA: TonB-dependent receptor plug domain-containing protein [Flavisolibacter sp.]|nr:TonB-dependent receptor plug domain-containing protein [Flavisolibacter sp.]